VKNPRFARTWSTARGRGCLSRHCPGADDFRRTSAEHPELLAFLEMNLFVRYDFKQLYG